MPSQRFFACSFRLASSDRLRMRLHNWGSSRSAEMCPVSAFKKTPSVSYYDGTWRWPDGRERPSEPRPLLGRPTCQTMSD